MELTNMKELEDVINIAIDEEKPLSLLIEMPGFPKPEMITNPVENLPKKLEYYKSAYSDTLEHKHSEGIKIIGYSF